MKSGFQHTVNAELNPDEALLGMWVKDPAVLFFLGPECSIEDKHNSPGWAQLVERVQQVKAACPTYDGIKIASFISSLLPGGPDDSVPGLEPLEPALVEFEVAVADLAMRATELYVDTVLEPLPDAVRHWSERRASVRLLGIDEALIVLREARAAGAPPTDMNPTLRRSGEYLITIDQAIAAAALLSERAVVTRRDGPARPLGNTFEDRMAQLLGAPQVHASLEALRRQTVEEEEGRERISLRGEDVEWLTNLLWHSLRFDLPIYPTGEELGFQLALNSGQRRPKDSPHIARPRLSLATQDAESPQLVAEALGWVVEATMATNGLSATSRRLFTAIAGILDRHAATWTPGMHSDSTSIAGRDRRSENGATGGHASENGASENDGNGEGDDGDSDAHEFVPVVFSTSFDQQLERTVLATATRTEVQIFVPVLVINSAKSTQADFRWIYGTARAAGSDSAADRALKSLTWNWVPTEQADWPVDSGISIVKINGAPLYRDLDGEPLSRHPTLLQRGPSGGPRYRPEATVRHALVLSEFELLRNLRIESTAKESFLGVLQSKGKHARRVLFLGHPIHDWLTRIRLLTRLFEPMQDGKLRLGDDQKNILFSKTIEPVRASLLFWADISPVLKDLSWVEATLTERVEAGW